MSFSHPSILEGELIAGKYRVERVLGEGGMGIVVAAVHEQLQQRVAIKFVRPEALANPEAVARFVREARAAAALKSEHVAKVTDVGTLESGAPYMVMEYLTGSDLNTILEERGSVPIADAAEWLIQACEAVAEAHSSGIVHRDLKPQNLFLARTVGGGAAIKVLDFGVSKSLDGSLTNTTALLGSPLYMAPEQMRSSRDVTPRSDVWALGVVLFQLVTGQMPFPGTSLPELCLKVAADPPVPVRDLLPDAPPELFSIIERCLEKDPARRYADASELATALEPLAPASASLVAERARLVMGTIPKAPAAAGSERRTAQTWKGAELPVTGRSAPTPAAWDARGQRTKSSRVGWIVGVIGVAGLFAYSALVWMRRNQPVGASLLPTSTTTASTTGASIRPEPLAVAVPASVLPSPASATVAMTVAPPPPSASVPATPVPSAATATRRPEAPPSVRPPPRAAGDDIPAMR